jgi:NitT/TauT family transport system substrate-binding protein
VDRTVLSYGNGTGQKLACLFDQSTGGDGIIASADIKSVKDLAGKKVACETASTEYYFLSAVLADQGMTMDDIELVDMVTATGGAAFVAGEVDAVAAWEPWLSNANQREGGHVLVSSADYPYTVMDSLVVSGQFASEHPEAVDGLVSAWYDAIDYMNANMDECLLLMADGLALTVEDMESMLPGVTFTGREENEAIVDKAAETNIYDIAKSMLDFWISVGEVKEGTTVDGLFR